MSLIELIMGEIEKVYSHKRADDMINIKSILEKHLKQSDNVDRRMCSKCHKVHTGKQPNRDINFVCDDCVERI